MIKISLATATRRAIQRDAVLFLTFSDQRGHLGEAEQALLNPATVKKIQKFFQDRGFRSHPKELCYVPEQRSLFVFTGCGKKKELNAERLRRVTNEGRALFKKMNVPEGAIMVPLADDSQLSIKEKVQAIAESIWLGDYEFDKYKNQKGQKRIKELTLLVPSVTSELKQTLKKIKTVCEAVLLARDLENDHSDAVTPKSFAETARSIASNTGMSIRVLDEKQLKQQGFGLLTNVGRASSNPPRLIIVEYRGTEAGDETIALVGKGITFDTGGVNLKPAGSMIEEMHMDMSGAAVVLATLKAASELKLPVHLFGVMSLAENAIGGNAYKPGCVLTAYDGTTVEVGNTDAEGRLVLGDAMSYVVKHVKPTKIIDLATLTGAVLVAFGHRIAGLIANDDALAADLTTSGDRTFERVWRLPTDDDYREDIKSDKAEIKNIGDGRNAGVISGGLFIEHFVKKTPWAHIDIAGTSMLPKRTEYLPKGGTGFGIRLLIDFLDQPKIGKKS